MEEPSTKIDLKVSKNKHKSTCSIYVVIDINEYYHYIFFRIKETWEQFCALVEGLISITSEYLHVS